ncbi:type I-E CRISPR-associated endoribonuclease Cas2e [Xanthobacter agilis]|uniref:CRISPR-associated protein Cas2 n=2 Tax=Xanthobacter agilis TaxID=47492 RepID=A0ABU0LJH1_XANAG|nr:type I-E CRISPR-associated endoribonuclease Cas2e [Xanthobacter agilis]MDQ0507279.1 CRISPR-associated protein Cas2 [Xanthobacter agilis]
MTVVITRDVPGRTRGFLASIMPEPAPGVYAAADLSKAVRERLWAVVADWHGATAQGSVVQGSVVMIWRDDKQPGGLGLATLGTPPRRLADLDGVLVSVW